MVTLTFGNREKVRKGREREERKIRRERIRKNVSLDMTQGKR